MLSRKERTMTSAAKLSVEGTGKGQVGDAPMEKEPVASRLARTSSGG